MCFCYYGIAGAKIPINIDRKLPQTKTINTPSNKEKCFKSECGKITKCFVYFTVSHFVSDTTRRTYCTS